MPVSHLSRQEMESRVAAKRGGHVVDLTSSQVRWASKPAGIDPGDVDWVEGSWDTENGSFLAVVMVGPGVGSVGLEVGEPHLWIRITFEGEDDEDFIADTGPITVY